MTGDGATRDMKHTVIVPPTVEVPLPLPSPTTTTGTTTTTSRRTNDGRQRDHDNDDDLTKARLALQRRRKSGQDARTIRKRNSNNNCNSNKTTTTDTTTRSSIRTTGSSVNIGRLGDTSTYKQEQQQEQQQCSAVTVPVPVPAVVPSSSSSSSSSLSSMTKSMTSVQGIVTKTTEGERVTVTKTTDDHQAQSDTVTTIASPTCTTTATTSEATTHVCAVVVTPDHSLSSSPPREQRRQQQEQQPQNQQQQLSRNNCESVTSMISPRWESQLDSILDLLEKKKKCSNSMKTNNSTTPTTIGDCSNDDDNNTNKIVHDLLVRIDTARNGMLLSQEEEENRDDNGKSKDHRHHYRHFGGGGGGGVSSSSHHHRSSLVVGDNPLIRDIHRIVDNDPTITSLNIPHGDVRVLHLSKSFLIDTFVDTGLRSNLFLQRLSMTGLQLGNDFLSSLGVALGHNIALQDVTLHDNHFTSDGLSEFLQMVGRKNGTCQVIDVRRQRSTLFGRRQRSTLEALESNYALIDLKVDFDNSSSTSSEKETFDAQSKLDILLRRNRDLQTSSSSISISHENHRPWDVLLIEFLQKEAEMAECMCESPLFHDDDELFYMMKNERDNYDSENAKEIDWDYIYELSQLFNKYKRTTPKSSGEHTTIDGSSEEIVKLPQTAVPLSPFFSGSSIRFDQMVPGHSITATLTPDGSFITDEFISKYLKDHTQQNRLVFDFCGRSEVFKRFTIGDPCRLLIVTKFVDTLLDHPRAKDITDLNLANCCLGSDFVVHLAERCLSNSMLIPKLNSMNLETNYLGERGIVALSRCIADPKTWKYLQVVKLENQRSMLSSKAESFLARAICANKSVVTLSLRVRNLHERKVIDDQIANHLDLLRQARQYHEAKNGTKSPRNRTEMERFFDQIAANHPSVTEVKIVANRQFLSLSREEKLKAASALSTNTHVKTLTLNALGLDDDFARQLADSLRSNSDLEKLHLDNNSLSGSGITAIVRALKGHPKMTEIQIRHQSKTFASAEESEIPKLLDGNSNLIKIGLDLRSKHTELLLDRKLATNRRSRRSLS